MKENNKTNKELFFDILIKFYENTKKYNNVMFINEKDDIIIDQSWLTMTGFKEGFFRDIIAEFMRCDSNEISEYKIVKYGKEAFIQVQTPTGRLNIKQNRVFKGRDEKGVPTISFDKLVWKIKDKILQNSNLHIRNEHIEEVLVNMLNECKNIYLTLATEQKSKNDENRMFSTSFEISQNSEINTSNDGGHGDGRPHTRRKCFSKEEIEEIYEEEKTPIAKVSVKIKNKDNEFNIYVYLKEVNEEKGYLFFAEPTIKSSSTRAFYIPEEEYSKKMNEFGNDIKKAYEAIISDYLGKSDKEFKATKMAILMRHTSVETHKDKIEFFLTGKPQKTVRSHFSYHYGEQYRKLFGYDAKVDELRNRRSRRKENESNTNY